MFLGLGLLHVVSADLDPRGEDGPSKLHHVHPQKMAELLCNYSVKRHLSIRLLLMTESQYIQ